MLFSYGHCGNCGRCGCHGGHGHRCGGCLNTHESSLITLVHLLSVEIG